ncbi:DUF5681 domain-containing protein [Solilutibacter silvestris]|uniref:DUF5681 domain-containing protein n=1 Tax=Solilutibacter silvestris TaxID=1645665 RepID=UPI003D32EE6C
MAARSNGFKKGVSGNPGGRPKELEEVQKYARSKGMAAIKNLERLMKCGNQRVEVAATEALLNRAFGKPKEAVELSTPPGQPLEVAHLPIDPTEAARVYSEFMAGKKG